MRGTGRRSVALLAFLTACVALAGEAPEDVVQLRSALKGTLLMTRAREVSPLQPELVAAASLWRLRLEPRLLPATWLTIFAAYEQRVRLASSAAALSAPGLPAADAPAPFRVVALEGALSDGPVYSYWHEVDRLALALHLPRVELTLGRQAVGWGRGLGFGAIDCFAPFTPLEADREWRRGVDAARVDVQLGQKASVEALAVFSDAVERSAFMGRARGFLGPVDAELVGGWRAKDVVVGAAASAALLDAEVHGELAAFVLPEAWAHGGTFGNDRVVLKAVAGASYQLAVGDGLRVALEYQYSGFGLSFPVSMAALEADDAFRARLRRGDMQVLGRHVLAASSSYAFDLSLAGSLQVLVDPSDGSGVVAPALSWDVSDDVSLTAAAYAGWGELPRAVELRSQLGATPLAVLVQVRLYNQRSAARPAAKVSHDL